MYGRAYVDSERLVYELYRKDMVKCLYGLFKYWFIHSFILLLLRDIWAQYKSILFGR